MNDLKVLYLDNDKFSSSQVKMRLEWRGHQVTTINSQAQLNSEIADKAYDLLVVDFLTLGQDAFSILERLKLQKNLPATIMVTEEKYCHLMSRAMRLGCLNFVLKDVLIQQYLEQLNLCILQFFDQGLFSKHNNKHQQKTLDQGLFSSPSNVSRWEYYPMQNEVCWKLPEHSSLIRLSYDEFIARIHAQDLAHVKTQNNICLFSQEPVDYTFRYSGEPDQIRTYKAEIKANHNGKGQVDRLYGRFELISKQHVRDQIQPLQLSFIENTADAVFITNADQQIVSINKAFSQLFGYSEKDVLNTKSYRLNSSEMEPVFFNPVVRCLKHKRFWQGEVLIHHADGYTIPVWESISVLLDSQGRISQSISVLRDISEQKAYEESIRFQANYDHLTQLPNRTLFLDRLENAIKRAERNNNKFAVMLIDLDKFKWINDTMGHHAGDILLQQTAKKLQSAVRDTDTVARLGGDEFSVIIQELDKAVDVETIVGKIFNSFKAPIFIEDQEIFISGSIGITIFPDDGVNIDVLQQNADNAMYMAKNNGRNRYCYFTPALQQETERRLQLIDKMRSALDNHEFSLHYQPIMDMVTKKVACAETLLRWKHPTNGYVPLSDFIPVAETSGIIREIGNWVIAEVANNISRWKSLGLSYPRISLNQSVAQYSLSECHEEWLGILKTKKITTDQITFEVSENLFFQERNNYINSIEKLQQEGIQISLDGFGTGYSSLSHLQKKPIDVIKIDRSFIHSMINDPSSEALVEAVILVANKLGIKVIATGVESEQQMSVLSDKCRYAQGYFFSKPLPLNDFEAYIKLH